MNTIYHTQQTYLFGFRRHIKACLKNEYLPFLLYMTNKIISKINKMSDIAAGMM